MPTLKILIHEKDTPPVDDGSRPESFKGKLTVASAIILEKGMVSGDTSVVFRLDDENGGHYVAQMTGNIFRMLNKVFTGADIRFKEKNAKQN